MKKLTTRQRRQRARRYERKLAVDTAARLELPMFPMSGHFTMTVFDDVTDAAKASIEALEAFGKELTRCLVLPKGAVRAWLLAEGERNPSIALALGTVIEENKPDVIERGNGESNDREA